MLILLKQLCHKAPGNQSTFFLVLHFFGPSINYTMNCHRGSNNLLSQDAVLNEDVFSILRGKENIPFECP